MRDAGSTVVQAARDLHLSWPTVMNAFRTQAREVIDAPLPEVEVLGIDETRRGRPRWEQDPVTGKWHMVCDRWHTGFADALGTEGLLGQIEGRTVADVLVCLSATPLTWRKNIKYVAIDMSATYRAAIRIALPQAAVVVDHFQVVQLANKMLSMVRRRTTAEVRGWRGRASDPEWKSWPWPAPAPIIIKSATLARNSSPGAWTRHPRGEAARHHRRPLVARD